MEHFVLRKAFGCVNVLYFNLFAEKQSAFLTAITSTTTIAGSSSATEQKPIGVNLQSWLLPVK